jgi:hypothetical protein
MEGVIALRCQEMYFRVFIVGDKQRERERERDSFRGKSQQNYTNLNILPVCFLQNRKFLKNLISYEKKALVHKLLKIYQKFE